MNDESRTLLVTGASGQIGQQVIEQLLQMRAGRIVATTRAPERIQHFASRGVSVRRADFGNPESLREAFSSVERLLLISANAGTSAEQRLQFHRNAVTACAAAGVRHIVYTSITAPLPTDTASLFDDHFWTEHAIAATAGGWTILRNNLYMDQLLQSLPSAITFGRLTSAAGDGRINYVTRYDCARTAAAALAADYNGRRVLDVTGPRPIARAELAALVAETIGRPVRCVGVSPEELYERLLRVGTARRVAEMMMRFERAAACGHYAISASTVEQLTGCKPRSLEDFLQAHRDALLGSLRPPA